MTGDGAWHVIPNYRGGDGTFRLMRYVRIQPGRSYPSDVSTCTWPTREAAQKAADEANAGRRSFNMRGSYT